MGVLAWVLPFANIQRIKAAMKTLFVADGGRSAASSGSSGWREGSRDWSNDGSLRRPLNRTRSLSSKYDVRIVSEVKWKLFRKTVLYDCIAPSIYL